MKKSRKAEIQKLERELYSLQWEKVDVHASKMDPDMKAIYLNDIDYKAYCIQQKIEDIEHEEGMFPLKLKSDLSIITFSLFNNRLSPLIFASSAISLIDCFK
jgi:hypothetical protein